MKLDGDGVVQWITQLGDTTKKAGVVDANAGSDRCNSVDSDALGNVYCAGDTSAAIGEATASLYENDPFVMKLNSSGALQWVTQLGASTHLSNVAGANEKESVCAGVSVDYESHVYCAGWTLGNVVVQSNQTSKNILLFKLKPDGSI